MLFNSHISRSTMRQEDNMSVSVRTIISAAHRMGASVFKIQGSNVYFKFNDQYRLVSLQTILEYGK